MEGNSKWPHKQNNKCCVKCFADGTYPYKGDNIPYCMFSGCPCHIPTQTSPEGVQSKDERRNTELNSTPPTEKKCCPCVGNPCRCGCHYSMPTLSNIDRHDGCSDQKCECNVPAPSNTEWEGRYYERWEYFFGARNFDTNYAKQEIKSFIQTLLESERRKITLKEITEIGEIQTAYEKGLNENWGGDREIQLKHAKRAGATDTVNKIIAIAEGMKRGKVKDEDKTWAAHYLGFDEALTDLIIKIREI